MKSLVVGKSFDTPSYPYYIIWFDAASWISYFLSSHVKKARFVASVSHVVYNKEKIYDVYHNIYTIFFLPICTHGAAIEYFFFLMKL